MGAAGSAKSAGMIRISTPWLRRIFEDSLELDLQVIEVELTLAHVNASMASLRDLAASNLKQAHAAAREAGEQLAMRLLASSAFA